MENNYKKVMQARSDYELVEIVTTLRNDYQPEAVIAAEAEIQLRNLDVSKVQPPVKEEKPKMPFDKRFIIVAGLYLVPVILFLLFLAEDDVFNIFFLPVTLVSLFPCGLTGMILSTKAHGKTFGERFGINHILAPIGIVIGGVMTLSGIFGIMLVLVVSMP